jgi:orotate phosphoribosyltransferase
VAAAALVDRGDRGRRLFTAEGIPYLPLLTYADLGIDPVA